MNSDILLRFAFGVGEDFTGYILALLTFALGSLLSVGALIRFIVLLYRTKVRYKDEPIKQEQSRKKLLKALNMLSLLSFVTLCSYFLLNSL